LNGPDSDILAHAVALACDAHTTFVHIYPFPDDGSGRLARILSGIVLQAFGLHRDRCSLGMKGLNTLVQLAMQLFEEETRQINRWMDLMNDEKRKE
jgi:hypothetical protein